MRASDQSGQMFPRSKERIFSLQQQWYFQTREYDHGPFQSRQAAEAELQRYVYDMQYCNAANRNPVYLFGTQRPAPRHQQELRRA